VAAAAAFTFAVAVFFLLLAVAAAVELPAPIGGFWFAVAAVCRSLPILLRSPTPRARKRGQERPAEEPAGAAARARRGLARAYLARSSTASLPEALQREWVG
jgi:hypothetical protein